MIGDGQAVEPGPVATVASGVGASTVVAIPVVWGGSVIRSVQVRFL